jgi:hypothetical protein
MTTNRLAIGPDARQDTPAMRHKSSMVQAPASLMSAAYRGIGKKLGDSCCYSRKINRGLQMIVAHIRDDHLPLLEVIEKSSHAMALTGGNAQAAKHIRRNFSAAAQSIRGSYNEEDSSTHDRPSGK